MNGAKLHVEFARLAYHLLILKEHGELHTWQKSDLTHALRWLQRKGFDQLLTIAQEPKLEKSHSVELRGLHEKLRKREMFTFT